eukprot:5143889-Pleurochrysis_carterae.AAC.1
MLRDAIEQLGEAKELLEQMAYPRPSIVVSGRARYETMGRGAEHVECHLRRFGGKVGFEGVPTSPVTAKRILRDVKQSTESHCRLIARQSCYRLSSYSAESVSTAVMHNVPFVAAASLSAFFAISTCLVACLAYQVGVHALLGRLLRRQAQRRLFSPPAWGGTAVALAAKAAEAEAVDAAAAAAIAPPASAVA